MINPTISEAELNDIVIENRALLTLFALEAMAQNVEEIEFSAAKIFADMVSSGDFDDIKAVREREERKTDRRGTGPDMIKILFAAVLSKYRPNEQPLPGFTTDITKKYNINIFEVMLKHIQENLKEPFPKTFNIPLGIVNHITSLTLKIDKNGKASVFFFNSLGGGKNSSYYSQAKPFIDALQKRFNIQDDQVYANVEPLQKAKDGEVNDLYCGHWATWFCEMCEGNPNDSFSALSQKIKTFYQQNDSDSARKEHIKKYAINDVVRLRNYKKYCKEHFPQVTGGFRAKDIKSKMDQYNIKNIGEYIINIQKNNRGVFNINFAECDAQQKFDAYKEYIYILGKSGKQIPGDLLNESDRREIESIPEGKAFLKGLKNYLEKKADTRTPATSQPQPRPPSQSEPAPPAPPARQAPPVLMSQPQPTKSAPVQPKAGVLSNVYEITRDSTASTNFEEKKTAEKKTNSEINAFNQFTGSFAQALYEMNHITAKMKVSNNEKIILEYPKAVISVKQNIKHCGLQTDNIEECSKLAATIMLMASKEEPKGNVVLGAGLSADLLKAITIKARDEGVGIKLNADARKTLANEGIVTTEDVVRFMNEDDKSRRKWF